MLSAPEVPNAIKKDSFKLECFNGLVELVDNNEVVWLMQKVSKCPKSLVVPILLGKTFFKLDCFNGLVELVDNNEMV
jgi:hypothetical protein